MKTDLNDHMDDLIERFMHEDLKKEDLEKLTKIAKAVTDIAKVKLHEKKLKIEALKVLNDAGFVPKSLAEDVIKTHLIEQKLIN